MKVLLVLLCTASFCYGALYRSYFSGNFQNHFEPMVLPSRTHEDSSVKGIEKLTTSLLHDIHAFAGKGFNIIVSPFSIWAVLAMLIEGSGGKTERELRTKLRLSPNEGKETLRNIYKNIKNSVKVGPTEFTSLNFVVSNKMINPGYKSIVREFYDGQSFQADAREGGQFLTMVNRWAAQASRNRIQSIVSPVLLSDLVLLIGNAVYFKSKWKHPFDRSATVLQPFKDENGRNIKSVPMMNQFLVLPYTYSRELEAEMVEIPYADGVTSMIVILPKERTSLLRVLYKLKNFDLDRLVPRNMTEETVELSLPRFHIVNNMFLNEFLRQELPSVFSRQFAEFPNIDKDVYVSKISHKAEIENNEEGTTASAVTTVQFAYKSSGVSFRADRPFVYLITEIKSRAVLFAGTYSNPFTS